MVYRISMIALLALLLNSCAVAQRGYTEQIRQDGLKIATKWGKAKDEDGARKKALLIAVENTNPHALEYEFNILFYYEGRLRETGMIPSSCIEGLKSKVGKLTGTYFIPTQLSEEQLGSPDFGYELDNIQVERVDECTDEKE